MVMSQSRATRKPSGARYKNWRGKRKYELGRLPSLTKLGKHNMVKIKVRGNNDKYRLLGTDIANIFDPKEKRYKKAKIKTIVENPANRHFVRRNIMTKGSVVETDIGRARITSRPGQDGIVNAVLIS
jgi:small subunit ribosomal protein S8e